jgi:hypothetical protein
MKSFKRHLEEKLKASDDMGDWVKDFQDSDAPQFKGKSQKKRQQMDIAAKLSAERNEEVELDEARKSDSYQFTHKPGDAESEKKLADLKKSVKGTGKRVVLQGRLGKDNPNAHKYSKNAPRAQYKDGKRVNSDVSGKSGGRSHQRIQKADAAHHDVYVYDRRESFELDEVSDKKLDAYRQKAFADQPSGDDGSDKYRKRKFGRDLAFAKQTGRAKVLATKESVELDEVYNDPTHIKKTIPALRNAVEFHKDTMKDHDKKSVKGSPEYVRAHSAAAKAHKEAAERHHIAHAQLSAGSKDVEYYVKPARELGAYAKKLSDKANKLKEEAEFDEQTQYDLVESYLLENNIDVDTLSVEQLDEIIGKAIGGAFKLGAKAVTGAARRMTTAGKADAAEKRAATAEKKNKDRERIEKARQRLRAAQQASRA